MKIKSLLVCFLAVVTIALSSCGEEEDYAADFLGSYAGVISGEISFMMGEVSQKIPFDTLENYYCSITRVGEANNVTVTITDGESPFFISNAVCDETGMHLGEMTLTEIFTHDYLGEVSGNMTLGSTAVSTPANGIINWTSAITGSITMNVMGVPVESSIEGSLTFEGNKIN